MKALKTAVSGTAIAIDVLPSEVKLMETHDSHFMRGLSAYWSDDFGKREDVDGIAIIPGARIWHRSVNRVPGFHAYMIRLLAYDVRVMKLLADVRKMAEEHDCIYWCIIIYAPKEITSFPRVSGRHRAFAETFATQHNIPTDVNIFAESSSLHTIVVA